MISWVEFIKGGEAEANVEMSASEWLDWYKKKKKERQERYDKEASNGEKASMTKPQPLEVVTDGELEEIKKDPHEEENFMDAGGNPQKKTTQEIKQAWKAWLETKSEFFDKPDEGSCPTCGMPKNRREPSDNVRHSGSELLGLKPGIYCKDCADKHKKKLFEIFGISDKKDIKQAWKSWLEVRKAWEKDTECPSCKQTRPDHRYRCPHCGAVGYDRITLTEHETEKKKREKDKAWKSWLETKKTDKKWRCNLCNIELPDDELADQRKNRHTEFHTNEKVGTSKRPRNWTFGETNYELKSLELKVKVIGVESSASRPMGAAAGETPTAPTPVEPIEPDDPEPPEEPEEESETEQNVKGVTGGSGIFSALGL